MSEARVSVVVTGTEWMGSGIGSIESALERLFREAKQEIILAVYAISDGAELLVHWLENALARGASIRFVTNQLPEKVPQVIYRLVALQRAYSHLYLYEFAGTDREDLHAKVVVVDRRMALVGSSNLSYRGMTTNLELALLVEGPAAADVARALDSLFASDKIRPFTL